MRLALYARVSTDRHKCRSCKKTFALGERAVICLNCGSTDVEKGQDPRTQIMPLLEYGAAKHAEVTEYIDRGVSGSKDSRPELDRLMADVRRGKFDTVVVVRFDRFARSVKHLIAALEEFQALGIGFVSLAEAIDTNTPAGRMVFIVIGAVAELERSLIRERTLAGLARAEAEGKTLGPPRKIFDREKVRAYYSEVRSLRKTAVEFDLSPETVRRTINGS